MKFNISAAGGWFERLERELATHERQPGFSIAAARWRVPDA
jgi:hypothetical protein